MSFDDGVSDVNKFKQWAVLMGCPLESLPLDDTLRRYYSLSFYKILFFKEKNPAWFI